MKNVDISDAIINVKLTGPLKNFGRVKFDKAMIALEELGFTISAVATSKTREQNKLTTNTLYSSTRIVKLPFNDGVIREIEVDGSVDPKIFNGLVFQYYEDNGSFGNILIYSKNGKTNFKGSHSFPVLVYGSDYWKRRRNPTICDNDAFYYGSNAYENVAA